VSDERFEVYRTVENYWAVIDTETDETLVYGSQEVAEEQAQSLNDFPWTSDTYSWNRPQDAPERWDYEAPEDIEFPTNMWAPEVAPRPEVGEARQLATGLAMLGFDKASTTILNLIKLVEDN
jgi:hypothetical protein